MVSGLTCFIISRMKVSVLLLLLGQISNLCLPPFCLFAVSTSVLISIRPNTQIPSKLTSRPSVYCTFFSKFCIRPPRPLFQDHQYFPFKSFINPYKAYLFAITQPISNCTSRNNTIIPTTLSHKRIIICLVDAEIVGQNPNVLEASNEDINNAYRRLSRLYHPDKHVDPLRKKDAELLFHKIKKAYEVLSDPHKRAIYDSLGTKGLETEGWEVVQRTKTPQEIREEYERLAREREERRLQQRTNPRGNVTVNINATEMFAQYDEDDYEYELPLVEISGMSISQSVEAPLTMRNMMTIGGELSSHNGTGTGALTLSAKRLLQDNKWVELDLSVGNGVVMGLKHFRSLTRRVFGTGTLQFHFTDNGIRPSIETTLAMQLDEHTMGYLTYRAGVQSSMTTSIAHNSENVSVSCAITLGVPHSFLSVNCSYNFKEQKLKMRTAVKAGTFGAMLEYSAEKKVSEQSALSAAVSVGVPSGVRLKIKVVRGTQTYLFPIHLCEEPLPSPIFYATVVPLIAYAVIKRTIIDPIVAEQEQRTKERQREANKNRMAQMRREATAAVNLMGVTFSRIRAAEEAVKGLIVVKALYGRLARLSEGERNAKDEIIDVTIPLQCLVKDSKLVLHDASKSQLPGFYDPCVGEDKGLYVQYLFHSHLHEVLCPDNESLRIPKQSHRMNPT